MHFDRSAGILLHPTSLPGAGGIGTLGSDAYHFVDQLAAAGMTLWQVLPLGPTGYGDSPYAGLSAFAGNPLLLSLERLGAGEITTEPERFGSDRTVDFGRIVVDKMLALRECYARNSDDWRGGRDGGDSPWRNPAWLDDFALFMALKDAHGGAAWSEWGRPLRDRQPRALERAGQRLSAEVDFHRWLQIVFLSQWTELKKYANSKDIKIIGDIPIFVAHDSADVWARPELFRLDGSGTPEVVAGVPPDYFSRSGQLWGNPHYRWDVLARDGYKWWIERFRSLFALVDIVRLDHFRGFVSAWAVAFAADTAIEGSWEAGPGENLFHAVLAEFGELPIIAENLGVITPEVEDLRRSFSFPGMSILQFAFDSDAANTSLPHHFERSTVVYTGTHDNDTTLGWWNSIPAPERRFATTYLHSDGIEITADLMRLAFASVADLAIVPMQDVLGCGSEARMNLPGRPYGNWSWRFAASDFTPAIRESLRSLTDTYGRLRPAMPPTSID